MGEDKERAHPECKDNSIQQFKIQNNLKDAVAQAMFETQLSLYMLLVSMTNEYWIWKSQHVPWDQILCQCSFRSFKIE